MARHRLGVALMIPSPVAEQVDGLRMALRDPSRRRIAPHITLVPPVNVNDSELDAAMQIVRAAAAAEDGPIELTIGPVTSFMPRNPVLYLRVDGRGLPAVRRLRDALARGPLIRETSFSFVPHVTVADGIDETRIPAAELALDSFETTVDITSIHVLEHAPTRVWTSIAEMPFR